MLKGYRIEKFLADGTFGRVMMASKDGQQFAIKVIRPVPRYVQSAKIEAEFLEEITDQKVPGLV